jgi:pimeloyl-ACP methyl ester carboxylesterase
MISGPSRGREWEWGLPVTDESRKIDLGTHAIRVRESGSGARTFLCLHGFLDGTAVWDGVAPGLATLGRVILVQQRAHGDSTAPTGGCAIGDLAVDVVKILDGLGVQRATLVGHGLGGLVALTTALQAPDRVEALALISTVSEIDERAVAQWAQVVRAGEVNKLQGLARSVFGPTSRREVDGDGMGLTEIARALLTARLSGIRCPTVVVAGQEDAAGVAAARVIAAQIPAARLEILAGQHDAAHVGAPDAVVAAIRGLTA